MIPVVFENINLDPILEGKLKQAAGEVRAITNSAEKYQYIEAHSELWRQTLGALVRLTGNAEDNCKCWYCECDGSAGFYFQVDHFRPKSRVRNRGDKIKDCEPGYWWLAFDPKNYRVACQRCNTGAGKKDQFPRAADSCRAIVEGGEIYEKPLLLDPTIEDEPRLLSFTEDGNVWPAAGCDEKEQNRVEVSISVFNLRVRSKRLGRGAIWKECRAALIEATRAHDQLRESMLLSQAEKASAREKYALACRRLARMTRASAKFSSTAKSCIKDFYYLEEARSRLENLNSDLKWLLDLI